MMRFATRLVDTRKPTPIPILRIGCNTEVNPADVHAIRHATGTRRHELDDGLLRTIWNDGYFPHIVDDMPRIVHECLKRLRSRFYSVDVVQRTDGRLRIVEVGDGQVSDLVGSTPKQFAAILAEHLLR